MDASFFIAGRLRVRGRIVVACITVSFLVMIVAVSISSGYRSEIRSGLSELAGDVQITSPDRNVLNEERPIEADPAYLPYINEMKVVDRIVPVVYRAGIFRKSDEMYGIMLKGLPGGVGADTVDLAVSIPGRLAEKAGLARGDRMLTYFVGEKIKVRQFKVADVYDDIVDTEGKYLVYASMSDLQRLNDWADDEVSAVEIILDKDCKGEGAIRAASDEIGHIINSYSSEEDEAVVAVSSVVRFPQLFNWLDLIDFNVLVILVLMMIVAVFNMISGLLIMLFEHISTIGLLKSLGMTDKSIARLFLSSSAILVGKGLAIGNILAIILCVIQKTTHILKLNPENYYVSFVPVDLDLGLVFAADLIAFVVIMLFLLIPCMFISRVDPAETVRVR